MEREKEKKEIIIKKIAVGFYQTNCYLVADKNSGEAVIIDPGDEPEQISAEIEKANLRPKFILLTHNHPDHTGALEEIKNLWSCDVLRLKEGEKIRISNLEIRVVETPGHTPESVCYIIDKNIFSGDTLFKQGIGRTDLEGGDYAEIKKSLKCLMEFPDDFRVFPGHGEETTIGEERKTNPFL